MNPTVSRLLTIKAFFAVTTASAASVGPTSFCATTASGRASGLLRAPARRSASRWSKRPVICAEPPVIGPLIRGAL
jgi:hypothetical protein